MTERLYYHDSFLCEFQAEVVESVPAGGGQARPALVLDRTAFYPTSGGQVFDTGWITSAANGHQKLRVAEVAERQDGAVLHFLDAAAGLPKGSLIHGVIDAERRRDHMQQHSGQHVLSAAFIRLFNLPTVSFHMGADYCSIDLEARSLNAHQVEAAESRANEVIFEDRAVSILFVSQEQAQELGLRKIPPVERDQLRLIEIRDFDLSACGGTHVASTGQIGCIFLRKTEKVRQGWRVEFVCGKRTVATARRDFRTLSASAALFSSPFGEIPNQIHKAQEELRAARKSRELLLEELAELIAARLLAETTESRGRKIVVRTYADRDINFTKLLAQKLTHQSSAAVVLLASKADQPGLVFAQSPGQPFDMGALMKQAMASLGGRGGGSRDMAQGGAQDAQAVEAILTEIAEQVSR